MNSLDPLPPGKNTGKKKLSCWALGGLGCLGVTVAVIVFIALAVLQGLHTKRGSQLYHELSNVWQKTSLVPQTTSEMYHLRGAILRYELKKQQYPATLAELYPEYLADKSDLHSKLDTNTDPSHQSFTYLRPLPNSPASTLIMTIKWSYTVTDGSKVQRTDNILSESLGGECVLTQLTDGKVSLQRDFDTNQDDD